MADKSVAFEAREKTRKWVPASGDDSLFRGNDGPPSTSTQQPAARIEHRGRFVEVERSAGAAGAAVFAPPVAEAFELLQAFDGTVERVSGEDISVVLRDITDPSNGDEEAVLSLSQFDAPERVAVGTPFYLMVGYRTPRSGRETVTLVRVRTIVPLSASQRARAKAEAKALFSKFGPQGERA